MTKRAFTFEIRSGFFEDRTAAGLAHPQSVGCSKWLRPVRPPLTGAKYVTFLGCTEVLFLWTNPAFPYNHQAGLQNVKVQCVVGRVIGRLQMQLPGVTEQTTLALCGVDVWDEADDTRVVTSKNRI